ncbi:putative mitochondrial protein [Cocos nucifera]|uniref:Putative mitochondrial protein n=1 Tax=Cocos nucifera TaxID=13894 RepID=A0A8K0ILJ1_COCNU|nr:putative mitochondrial protein [Cocos nucifera]
MNGPRVELEDGFPAGRLFAQGDDVILFPHYIEFPADAVDLSTRLSRRVPLFVPCVASPMDTVSEAAMAVGMAALGGAAIVHCNAAIVRSAKSRCIPLVTDPAFFAPSERIAYLTDFNVYVDDMLVKSRASADHLADLEETFGALRKHKMKLNPTKCAFGVTSGKFLGFMVSRRGIEANPQKIRAIRKMTTPKTIKEVQRLAGKVASLNRFVSRSAERCMPFFEIFRRPKNFSWTVECQQAFEELKNYLGTPPLLAKPEPGEELFLYLAVSSVALTAVLVREEAKTQ